jgi:hypothetical protein
MSGAVDSDGAKVSFPFPSMAVLMFYQAKKVLEKADSLRGRALKQQTNLRGLTYISDEEALFTYLQLCCSGVLGLYASLEAMVYELYARRPTKEVIIDGKKFDTNQLSTKSFAAKLTTIASQLSGKDNIRGTTLEDKANELYKIRVTIQHWDMPLTEDSFLEIPEKHPIKIFLQFDPLSLVVGCRDILNHYSLKE